MNEVVASEGSVILSQPELSEDSDSGVSNSDNVTNKSTPTLRGTAAPSTTVELFTDGLSIGITTADSDGNWTYSVLEAAALSDGSYAITAIARDEIDNSATDPIAAASPRRTHQEWRNGSAFAALKEDGSVVTWGEYSDWAETSAVITFQEVSAELQSESYRFF